MGTFARSPQGGRSLSPPHDRAGGRHLGRPRTMGGRPDREHRHERRIGAGQTKSVPPDQRAGRDRPGPIPETRTSLGPDRGTIGHMGQTCNCVCRIAGGGNRTGGAGIRPSSVATSFPSIAHHTGAPAEEAVQAGRRVRSDRSVGSVQLDVAAWNPDREAELPQIRGVGRRGAVQRIRGVGRRSSLLRSAKSCRQRRRALGRSAGHLSLPLASSEGCRPTCAQVENRDSGETETR